ncbi:MAG: DUF1743 domain-containing protein [archaeon]|nr:DUF1743 domain-containing protein [archaeon]
MSYVLTPKEVKERYGSMFCRGFCTIVDEKNNIAKVVETCTARGPVEWDLVNRKRAGGVILNTHLDGCTLTMSTFIGKKELKFGPSSAELGGQGLESLTIIDGKVHTVWKGIGGASIGIGACLPQAEGIIKTIYPDNFKIGGAHTASVEIITPMLIRVIVGIDDTDTKERGASWAMAMDMARKCPYGKFLEHKIIQLNPRSPNKTTNCCSTAVAFAIEPENTDCLVEFCKKFITENTLSDETAMAVFKGLKFSESFVDWCLRAKSTIYTLDEAIKVAESNDVEVTYITGKKGAIGAIAAIGCFDLGIKSAEISKIFE